MEADAAVLGLVGGREQADSLDEGGEVLVMLADAFVQLSQFCRDGLVVDDEVAQLDERADPGVGWTEMLFIIGPEAATARRLDRLQERMADIRTAATSTKDRMRSARHVVAEAQAAPQEKTEAARHNFIFGFHPSLNSRIIQLKRMGATKVQWTDRRNYSGWIVAAVVAVVVGSVVLLAVLGSK